MSFTGTPVSAQLLLDFRSLRLHNHTRPFRSGHYLPIFPSSKRAEVAHLRSGSHHCYHNASEMPELSETSDIWPILQLPIPFPQNSCNSHSGGRPTILQTITKCLKYQIVLSILTHHVMASVRQGSRM